MKRRGSLVIRVAWSSALGAAIAALFSALAASAFAMLLLQRAEDRRLLDAAVIFAAELAETPDDPEYVVKDETEETAHTGILFVAFGPHGEYLAGAHNVGLPASEGCSTTQGSSLRVCRAPTPGGGAAVTASAHALPVPLFGLAALAAAACSGILAWFGMRLLSSRSLAPLARLQDRIAELDVERDVHASLGAPEGIIEVDELRTTIQQLLARVDAALEQAQRFSANAAHELRTPLTAVSAELELLAENASAPPLRDDVLRAQRTLAELNVLVERLLILALPKHQGVGRTELVSLRDLVDDAVRGLPADERERVRTDDGDALVRGDGVLLGTMLTNAIGNALKYGEHAKVTVESSVEFAFVYVEDEGPGIRADEKERVFEPFFRSEDALRRRRDGHGLGLALIRHIAQAHGGFARFVDTHGPGARLEIRLHVGDAEAFRGA